MMNRRSWFLLALAAAMLVPATVRARGYGRSGGYVNTPFGRINMNSPEWRASGGNIYVYQEIMEEKMLMQQQQMLMKQQQQSMQMMQKMAKSQKNGQQPQPVNNVTSLAPARKKGKKKVRSAAPKAAQHRAEDPPRTSQPATTGPADSKKAP